MINILYRPRLANGKSQPLNWFIRLYRWTNIICWPLEDGAPYWVYLVDRFLWIVGFMVFVINNDAERRYLFMNFNNIDELLTGVPTYLVLMEIHLRAFTLGWRKTSFKELLKKFYAEIYIEEFTNPKHFNKIKRQMWPIQVCSILYICPLILYIYKAVYMLSTNKRELLYKMIPPMDYNHNFYIYFALLMSNVYVDIIIGTMLFGEISIFGLLATHLNGRYLLMRETLNNKVETILSKHTNTTIVAQAYEQVLKETLKENLRLNKFAQEIQKEFSFRIFIIFAFSAMLLCALVFKVYTSPSNSITFVFWAIGKVQDIVAFGQVGNRIISTTDQLSSMYYESKWEQVIERSSNAKDNVRLMKFVTLSVAINRYAFNFTGLNFFSVSLASALTVLHAAGSYITFLISIR